MLTMILLAKYAGLECASRDDVAIEFRVSVSDARASLSQLLKHLPPPEEIADLASDQISRKYDEYLPSEVLQSSFVDNVMNYTHAVQAFALLS